MALLTRGLFFIQMAESIPLQVPPQDCLYPLPFCNAKISRNHYKQRITEYFIGPFFAGF